MNNFFICWKSKDLYMIVHLQLLGKEWQEVIEVRKILCIFGSLHTLRLILLSNSVSCYKVSCFAFTMFVGLPAETPGSDCA